MAQKKSGLSWEEFLSDARDVSFSGVLVDGKGPAICVDVGQNGHSVDLVLDRKNPDNCIGRITPSVLELVRQLPDEPPLPSFTGIRGLRDLLQRIRLKCVDAGPDSVISVIFLAARFSGVCIPEKIWSEWIIPISKWEQTGNADVPERSWVVMASALAHQHLNATNVAENKNLALEHAWNEVTAFAVETLLQGDDPENLAVDVSGRPCLQRARAAYASELSIYTQKLGSCETGQLAVPVTGSDRRRLVDVLFVREEEFSGIQKVFARKDRTHSPLGQGFSVLVWERQALKEADPAYWVTISVDTETGIHLKDLWAELETLETRAWADAGFSRPLFREDGAQPSRRLSWLADSEQTYHEQWYLHDDSGLIGSPRPQTDTGADVKPGSAPAMGSLLSVKDVKRAMYRVYNPVQSAQVREDGVSGSQPLLDLKSRVVWDDAVGVASRRLYAGWWSAGTPISMSAARDQTKQRLHSAIFRTMAARTLGLSGVDALVDAPALDDIEIVGFGPGIAVVTNGGIFLLDPGQIRSAVMVEAIALAERQILLADRLDSFQDRIRELASHLRKDMKSRGSIRRVQQFQAECVDLQGQIIELRGRLDRPLETKEAELENLRNALALAWNSRNRLEEFAAQLEWLQQSIRSAEELRLFRAGRWAAGGALAFLAADSLNGPLASALSDTYPEFKDDLPLMVFLAVLGVSLLVLAFLSWLLRRPVSDRKP